MALSVKNKVTFDIFIVGRALIKSKGKYLLLKRKPDIAYGATWELPGGKIELLEPIIDGVVREVFEETGLIIDLTSNNVHFSTFIANAGSHLGSTYHNILFSDTKISSGFIRLDSEHQSFGWFTKTEIFKLTLADYINMPLTEILLPIA